MGANLIKKLEKFNFQTSMRVFFLIYF